MFSAQIRMFSAQLRMFSGSLPLSKWFSSPIRMFSAPIRMFSGSLPLSKWFSSVPRSECSLPRSECSLPRSECSLPRSGCSLVLCPDQNVICRRPIPKTAPITTGTVCAHRQHASLTFHVSLSTAAAAAISFNGIPPFLPHSLSPSPPSTPPSPRRAL